MLHLGDQLENVNMPRSRAVEAQKLMNHFAEFLGPGPPVSDVFNDPKKINEAADIIQKLHLISQELPEKYRLIFKTYLFTINLYVKGLNQQRKRLECTTKRLRSI